MHCNAHLNYYFTPIPYQECSLYLEEIKRYNLALKPNILQEKHDTEAIWTLKSESHRFDLKSQNHTISCSTVQGNYAVSGGVKGIEAVEAKAKSFKARMTVFPHLLIVNYSLRPKIMFTMIKKAYNFRKCVIITLLSNIFTLNNWVMNFSISQ